MSRLNLWPPGSNCGLHVPTYGPRQEGPLPVHWFSISRNCLWDSWCPYQLCTRCTNRHVHFLARAVCCIRFPSSTFCTLSTCVNGGCWCAYWPFGSVSLEVINTKPDSQRTHSFRHHFTPGKLHSTPKQIQTVKSAKRFYRRSNYRQIATCPTVLRLANCVGSGSYSQTKNPISLFHHSVTHTTRGYVMDFLYAAAQVSNKQTDTNTT